MTALLASSLGRKLLLMVLAAAAALAVWLYVGHLQRSLAEASAAVVAAKGKPLAAFLSRREAHGYIGPEKSLFDGLLMAGFAWLLSADSYANAALAYCLLLTAFDMAADLISRRLAARMVEA